MKIYTLPIEMVNALRSWFHPKDRSVILADDCFIEGEETTTPGNPSLSRGRLYWKNGYWTGLNNSGVEQILTGPALISETILTSNVTSLTFSGIPQVFRHLKLVIQGRTDLAAEADGILIRFNGDTGPSYDIQRITANNATVSGVGVTAQTAILAAVEAANSRANNFSPSTVDIFGYRRTDAEKWVHTYVTFFGDVSAASDMSITLRTGRWRNTTPISSITILPQVGTNFVSGSHFQLYGVN